MNKSIIRATHSKMVFIEGYGRLYLKDELIIKARLLRRRKWFEIFKPVWIRENWKDEYFRLVDLNGKMYVVPKTDFVKANLKVIHHEDDL